MRKWRNIVGAARWFAWITTSWPSRCANHALIECWLSFCAANRRKLMLLPVIAELMDSAESLSIGRIIHRSHHQPALILFTPDFQITPAKTLPLATVPR